MLQPGKPDSFITGYIHMTCFSNHLPTSSIFFTLFLIFCSCCSSVVLAAQQEKSDYELSLSFVPQEGKLIGTAKITIDPGRTLTLSLQDLTITGTLLQDDNRPGTWPSSDQKYADSPLSKYQPQPLHFLYQNH